MSKRKALSKRTRFEIFKRDGFKCLYCGATPVEKVLRVDHVVPVINGGTDDPTNLVTSCFDCNAGKGPVPLEQRKHSAGIATDADREHAEQIREWLKVQRDIESAKSGVVDDLVEVWHEHLGEPEADIPARLRTCLGRNSVHDVRDAIVATAVKRLHGSRQLKYFYGVLRAKRGETPEPLPPEPQKPKWSPRATRIHRHLVAWQKSVERHCIDDVFREFTIAAWGSPDELECAQYSTEWEGGVNCRCRGFVLRTEPAEAGKLRWWVEDDKHYGVALIAIGLINGISAAVSNAGYSWSAYHSNGNGAPPMTLEEAQAADKDQQASLSEAEEFLRYLISGDETQLRLCREHFGWPVPKWLVDP